MRSAAACTATRRKRRRSGNFVNRKPSASTLNETQARYVIIDPALRDAGWNLDDRTQVEFEIPVDGYDAEPWNGVTDLERTLHRELGEGDLQLSPKLIRIAYGLKTDNFLGFLRHVLTLDAISDCTQVVQRAFEHHVAAHRYNADQIRFLRTVQELFLKQRRLAEADLYEPPLTVFGRNAVDRFFSPAEVREILDLTEKLAA
jgi:type I site-specific restriction endonuclease